mgnify:CR=1 FL=1|jgi:hypothetical protein
MALTSVNISQQISANLTAQGIRSSIPLGGTNTVTDSCDIGFELSMRCGNTSNSVTLHYANGDVSNKPTLHASNSTSLICDQQFGANKAAGSIIQDPSMTDAGVIAELKAVYYEAPTTNTGIVTITSEGNALGDLELKSAGASVLIVPRISATTALETTFTFNTVGDVVKVVVLGNSS